MKRPIEPMPKRTRAKSPWPRGAKKRVYEEMQMENARANGLGYERSLSLQKGPRSGETIDQFNDRATAEYNRYTDQHHFMLKGMIKVAALVEGRSEEDVLRDVRGY